MLATAAATSAGEPLDLMRRVMHYNLHPEDAQHPSWLPATWPARHRSRLASLGPGGRAVLSDVLRRDPLSAAQDFRFDSRIKRLLLLEGAALRRLAFYTSLCAHAPLLQMRRSAIGSALRRQARRIDADAADFVVERTPRLRGLAMSSTPFESRPHGCGRVLFDRGYRLLLSAMAPEGDVVVQRMRRRLPRRVAALSVPVLAPEQIDQLGELMLCCVVPERLATWDWLF